MLRVTELMIDDWVCINDSNYQVQDLKKKGVVKLYTTTEYGIHEIVFNTDFLEKEMKPIPLTPKILGKNGFEEEGYYFRNKELGYLIRCGRMSERAIVRTRKADMTIPSRSMMYVHQLQHLLKNIGCAKKIIV